MSRRLTVPGADELFRATSPSRLAPVVATDGTSSRDAVSVPAVAQPNGAGRAERNDSRSEDDRRHTPASVRQTSPRRGPQAGQRPTGRERHEEKITVYVSADELFDLERARLMLRGEHGLAVDRGRIVREAVAVVLADLEAKGGTSILVRRLLTK